MDGLFLTASALAAGGLALGLGLARGSSLAFVASAIPACLLALVVGLLWARKRRGVAALVLLAFMLGAVRASRTVTRYSKAIAAAPSAAVSKPRLLGCDGEGTIDTSPTQRGPSVRLVLSDVALGCDASALEETSPFARGHTSLTGRVGLFVEAEGGVTFARGDRVAFVASLGPPQRFEVPELGDETPGRARGLVVLSGGAADVSLVREGRGPGHAIDRARAHVRRRIQATFPPKAEGLARALVLGESDLSDEDSRDFRDSGLSHLLAVSGMHLVVAVNGLVVVLTALLARVRPFALRVVPRRAASVLGLVFCWIYCDFSGSSGSAVRAACMLSVQLLAVALGRRARPLRTLGWSIALVAMFDPLAVYDVSFMLSAAATLGLVALGGPLSAVLGSRGPSPVRTVGASLATTLAATLPCAPILLRMGPALSLGGLFANLVAVPVGELGALPICLGHSLLAPLPSAERGAALAGGGALLVVRAIAHATASSRLGRVPLPRPTDLELGLVAALAIWIAFHRTDADSQEGPALAKRALASRRLRFVCLGLGLSFVGAEALARHEGRPRGILRVTFLDVGQGDSAIVDLPNGEALLIDAGGLVGSPTDPGERVIAPLLRARRRDALRAVLVSHPHPDHFMGLRAALTGIDVQEVWDTGEIEDAERSTAHPSPFGPEVYAATLRDLSQRGTRIVRPDALCAHGGRHELGGTLVEVLAPCPRASRDRGTNDNSLVVRITFGSRRILFVGDAERATEADLVRTQRNRLASDVLKVGHHGSRSSSTAPFLEAVSPSLAVVSCGIRNRYGHPHRETLTSFAGFGRARLLRTDCHGSVVVTTDGRGIDAETAQGGCGDPF